MSLTLRAGALPPHASQQVGQEIAAFSANRIEQLRLAEVLAFRLDGLPGAQARVEIKGAPPILRLGEIRTGRWRVAATADR
jgi:hypothetical protein